MVLISQAYGRKSQYDINRYARITLYLGLFLTTIISLLFIFHSETLLDLYAGKSIELNREDRNLSYILFMLMGFKLILDSITATKISNLRGILDIKFPMVIGVLGDWIISTPIGYLFCFIIHMGAIGFILYIL